MQEVYEKLELGEFETVRPALQQYVEGMSGYETNRYELAPELRDRIARRWAAFIRKYGYASGASADASIGQRDVETVTEKEVKTVRSPRAGVVAPVEPRS
jgi:hypothetical protein